MADDEQFSLCWNNFNTNLSAGFHESLVRGDLVDVTLAAEGQLVKAHRLILSVCSPYFRKMFTQMPANQHAFIFLKDVSHSALKDLIQFMYCGEVNVKQDALPAFISTAEALQIKGLTETGESAPTHPSPAKEPSHLPSASSTTIPSVASSPRAKPAPRSRIQSYKLDSDDGSDHEKVVQIQATSTPASVASASSTAVTGQVSVPQQVQILQQQSQKRTLQQRTSITPQSTQVMKRAKLTDPLEASEPTQIQTVQIVKQITQTPQPTISSEPEYVEMPIETINPKAEPEYADDPSEVEAIEAEHEQEQSLAEQDTAEHDQDQDDSAHYVEDETYGDMSKYDETYFAEGDDAKAGASGFGSESYAESGTGADQAAQGPTAKLLITKQRGSNSKKWSDTAQTYQRYPTEFPVSLHEQESAVPGFRFPIETEADIERLEKTVRTCPETRRKFISFLRRMKQPENSIESIFKSVFYDEALSDYNYNGFCNSRRTKKRAMKTYAIFTSCLFEAWMMYGITATQIRNMLGKIVRNLHGRKRFRRYRDRVREQRNTENVIYLEEDDFA